KGEADVFQQFMDDMERLNGWSHDLDSTKKNWITASDLQAKFNTWVNDRGMGRMIDVDKEIKKLKDDGRIARASNQNRLLGWTENSNFVRNHTSDLVKEL